MLLFCKPIRQNCNFFLSFLVSQVLGFGLMDAEALVKGKGKKLGASGETIILFYSRVLCGSVCILPLSNKSFYSIIVVYCNIYSNISCIFWNSFFLQNLLLIIIIPPLKRRKVYSVLPLCVRWSVCQPVCLTVYLGGFFCTNLTSTSC